MKKYLMCVFNAEKMEISNIVTLDSPASWLCNKSGWVVIWSMEINESQAERLASEWKSIGYKFA